MDTRQSRFLFALSSVVLLASPASADAVRARERVAAPDGITCAGFLLPRTDYTAGASPVSVAIGDFDEDGDPDLAVANRFTPSISVFLNDGDGTFAAPIDVTVTNEPTWVATADLDGDSHLD